MIIYKMVQQKILALCIMTANNYKGSHNATTKIIGLYRGTAKVIGNFIMAQQKL